jgi:5-methylcytosine-specific restriction endonuclease McrA
MRPEYRAYLQSEEWAAKRDAALERAEHRCQLCNSEHDLTVHHRTYERLGNERDADLTVLCKECHYLFHGRRPWGRGKRTRQVKGQLRLVEPHGERRKSPQRR